MRQVLLYNDGRIQVEEIPHPLLKGEGVIVRTLYSVISSGTESSMIRTSSEKIITKLIRGKKLFKAVRSRIRLSYLQRAIQMGGIPERLEQVPSGMGYSSTGIVVQSNCDFQIGEKVACMGAPHAEMAYVPKNLCARIPNQVDIKEAAFGAIGCIALHSVRKADIQLGETVVVVGLGIVGQLVVEFVKQAGARAIGVDLRVDRLNVAKLSGAEFVIQPGVQNVIQEIRFLTTGRGADAVLICASSQSPHLLEQAMMMCRDRGRVVITGDIPIVVPRGPFYHKELDLMISRSYGPGRYDKHYEEEGIDYPRQYVRWTELRNLHEFLDLLKEGKIHLSHFISEEVQLNDIQTAYEEIRTSNPDNLSVVIKYPLTKRNEKSAQKMMTQDKPKDGTIRIGLIGCGTFAQQFRLPNLHQSPYYSIRAIADSNPVLANSIGKRYQTEYCTSDYKDILSDGQIDMVLIATHHNLHAPISVEALAKRKHVFVEKPSAMNIQECSSLARAAQKSKDSIYGVGFNRRFSTLTIEVKQILREIRRPKIINYRVASMPISKDQWICDPIEGGGRIIGEAVHFIDLMYWLIGSEPKSITAHGDTWNSQQDGFSNENYVINIVFEDGSIGNLLHTDRSTDSFPKERIEIYTGGTVMVVDNFEALSIHTNGKTRVVNKVDKGFGLELDSFAEAILSHSPAPVGLKDGIYATVQAIAAMQSIREGKTISMIQSFREVWQ